MRRNTVEMVRSVRNARTPAVLSRTSAALRTLPTRGGCTQTLRDIVIACSDGRASAEAGLVAATHRSCPPGVLIDALPEILDAGSRASNPRTRLAVVAHPACSTQILNRMSLDRSLDVVGAVAAHPSTPTDRLADLSTYRDTGVRSTVAANPSCPSVAFDRFAMDPDYEVRSVAAANLECPSGALDRLSSDSSAGVRSTVASHPRCPSGVFERLAADPDAGVRSMVASRPGVGAGILQQLTRDTAAEVRSMAVAVLAGKRPPPLRRLTSPTMTDWLWPVRQRCRFRRIHGRFTATDNSSDSLAGRR